ncbi:MAG: hypothetical protein ABSC71_21965, partial [Candidatus Acidiferrales bacterium]
MPGGVVKAASCADAPPANNVAAANINPAIQLQRPINHLESQGQSVAPVCQFSDENDTISDLAVRPCQKKRPDFSRRSVFRFNCVYREEPRYFSAFFFAVLRRPRRFP